MTTMTEPTSEQPTQRFAPSARELWYTGSGKQPPAPTDEEVVAAIRYELSRVIRRTTLEEPEVKAALKSAARAVRALYPTNDEPKDQK